ncbi:ABC transporter ATP-binding protein [Quadrisphaera sp. GCM10027208]|uniref:ABC transporter ATP-binding protein n=1 Tax=Quadrisphaera sp. GCM10027208 TaxID=3273423 RepID=UPI00361D9E27
MHEAPALEVEHLTRRFGERTVVDDVTFTVHPGTITGFVGANGAGKTTTMRMIMGILAIHGGTVRWGGRPITAEDRAAFGYMPEERGLYPKQGVLDQLIYLGQLRGMTRGDAEAEARRLLDRFGLGARGKDKLESLSLGNQQRVQIAAALLHGPTALVLDEPFSGLDPVAVESMVDLLRDRLHDGVPVLFSSHQLYLVDRLCDSLVILSDGRVMAAGTSEELRSRGRRRYRIITEPDAGWLRGVPGVDLLDVEGARAVLEFHDDAAQEHVLRAAVDRGMREYTPIVPSLSEIFREVLR